MTPVSSPISHKHRSVTKEQPHFLESHVNTILVHARGATAIATHLFLALTFLTQHKCCESLPCCWVIGKSVFFSELHCMVKRGPSPGMAFRDFLFGVNVNQVCLPFFPRQHFEGYMVGTWRDEDIVQVVACLPSMHKILAFVSSTLVTGCAGVW